MIPLLVYPLLLSLNQTRRFWKRKEGDSYNTAVILCYFERECYAALCWYIWMNLKSLEYDDAIYWDERTCNICNVHYILLFTLFLDTFILFCHDLNTKHKGKWRFVIEIYFNLQTQLCRCDRNGSEYSYIGLVLSRLNRSNLACKLGTCGNLLIEVNLVMTCSACLSFPLDSSQGKDSGIILE